MDNLDFYSAILEALPIPVLVVDPEVRILFYNTAAAALVGTETATVIRNCPGDVLHCIHSTEALEGCGFSSFCSDCIIRNSVQQSLAGKKVFRKMQKMELLQNKDLVEIHLLVTTAPISYGESQLVMILLEDVSELMMLKKLIPICSQCKKVRDDQEYWHEVDKYLKDHWDLDFTHSLCPKCVAKLYPGFPA